MSMFLSTWLKRKSSSHFLLDEKDAAKRHLVEAKLALVTAKTMVQWHEARIRELDLMLEQTEAEALEAKAKAEAKLIPPRPPL